MSAYTILQFQWKAIFVNEVMSPFPKTHYYQTQYVCLIRNNSTNEVVSYAMVHSFYFTIARK